MIKKILAYFITNKDEITESIAETKALIDSLSYQKDSLYKQLDELTESDDEAEDMFSLSRREHTDKTNRDIAEKRISIRDIENRISEEEISLRDLEEKLDLISKFADYLENNENVSRETSNNNQSSIVSRETINNNYGYDVSRETSESTNNDIAETSDGNNSEENVSRETFILNKLKLCRGIIKTDPARTEAEINYLINMLEK